MTTQNPLSTAFATAKGLSGFRQDRQREASEAQRQGMLTQENEYLMQQREQQAQSAQALGQLKSQYGETGDPEIMRQIIMADPEFSSKIQKQFGAIDQATTNQAMNEAGALKQMLETNPDEAMAYWQQNLAQNQAFAGLADNFEAGDIEGAINEIGWGVTALGGQEAYDSLFRSAEPDKGADQSAFESLIADLPQDQQEEAILIKLGINPRAVSSAAITIAESDVLTEAVANSSAVIGERKKFGELTGSSRAQAIDAGFDRIVKIDAAVRNIDSAIEVLNSGAGVGAIERFIPSFKAASVALDNIQKSMALDVIGSVTFGALSQGELDLAKDVALPTGLDTPELIEYLKNRKAAQGKLRTYFNEQIQFLDQGGTIAGFLRAKERDANAGSTVTPQVTNQPAPVAAPVGTQPAIDAPIAWDDLP